MQNIPKISFIIPVYNVEHYLNQCIDSILNQNFNNFEIILVNDGSTDSSGDICNKYADNDSRIKVIHQKNGGSGNARNTGIRVAAGEYIIFMDGDDFLVENILKLIAETIDDNNHADVLLGRILYYFEDDNIKVPLFGKYNIAKIKNKDSIHILAYLFSQEVDRFWSVWNHVFRKKFILENDLFFKPGEHLEDFRLVPEIILKSSSFGVIQEPFYVYRKNRLGAKTTNKSALRTITWFNICAEWIKRFRVTESIDNKCRKFLIDKLVDMYVGGFTWDIIPKDRKMRFSPSLDRFFERISV